MPTTTMQGLTGSLPSFFVGGPKTPTTPSANTLSLPATPTGQVSVPGLSGPLPTQTSVPGVPQQYEPALQQAVSHIQTQIPSMGTSSVAAQLNFENGGDWNPTLPGRADPRDIGLAQLNTGPNGAIAAMTKINPSTGNSYFQQSWGHPFNLNDPADQLRLYSNYINYLHQYYIPQVLKIPNPTIDQTMAVYNNANNAKKQAAYVAGVNRTGQRIADTQ